MRLKESLIRRIPFLVLVKAWLVGFWDYLVSTRSTYSQSGEDQIVESLLEKIDWTNAIYVDIGANHPTRLSNTYRLYRMGWRGIVVEPNRSLINMHRCFRTGDEHLAIGCGAHPGILRFQHATSHVLSSFAKDAMKTSEINRSELIPVLPIDIILECHPNKEVALLSIDVEGFDFEVVCGASATLERTRIVVIEGTKRDTHLMEFFADKGFHLHKSTPHNLIFVRII